METTEDNQSKCANLKESGNSDENLELFCDPCQTEEEHLPAEGYCIECHEYLCKDCHRAHRRLVATKGHTVQQKEHMPNQRPESALKGDTCMPEMCPTHTDQPIDYYCTSHEDICCAICKSKRHVDCKDVKIISDMLNYVDIEQEYSNVKRKMKELVRDADNTQEQVELSLNAIELNHELAYTGKCELRKAVNDRLDQIECALDKKLYTVSKGDLKRITSYKIQCHAAKVDTNAMELYLESKMKSNKCQLFSALKMAEIQLISQHADLRKIRCNNTLTRYAFQSEQTVVNLKTAASFGNIVNEDVAKSHKQLGILNITSENNGKCLISGLVLWSRDHLVAVDNANKSVKMINVEEDRIVSEIMFESAPWDAAVINDMQIVVTLPEVKTLTFVTVNENKCLEILKEKQIPVSGKCYGVTSVDENIIVSMTDPAKLVKYDSSGNVMFSLNVDASEPKYVALNKDKTMIYMCNTVEQTCNLVGQTRSIVGLVQTRNTAIQTHIKEFSTDDGCCCNAETFTNCPFGVLGMATDNTGYLYCCDAQSRVIYTVSVDSEINKDTTSKLLVQNSAGLPQCLAYCNSTNRLFVGMKKGNVVVYYVV